MTDYLTIHDDGPTSPEMVRCYTDDIGGEEGRGLEVVVSVDGPSDDGLWTESAAAWLTAGQAVELAQALLDAAAEVRTSGEQ